MIKPFHLEQISLIPYQNNSLISPEEVNIGNIYCTNYNFINSSYELLKEFNSTDNTIIVPSSYRTRIFFETNNFDSIYFSVSTDFEREHEFFVYMYKISNKDAKINISLNLDYGDSEIAHETYSKWRECSFVNRIMSAPIITGDAALRCIDSGCDDIVVGCNDEFITSTGINIPILNSLDETVELIQKVDPTLFSEIRLIANTNSTDPITISKLLAFGADKIMLYHDLEFAKESYGWDNPNICQAIKNRSRAKVKHVCGIGDLKEGIPCTQIIEEYNLDLKQILFVLGLKSTEDFKEYALEHINLM